MSDVVIRVENLGKKYMIRHQQRERYVALRDVMAKKFKSFGSKIFSPFTFHRSPFTDSKEDFWALRDVSFEINQGDRVGIIGRNGAGKTTLLKLISRITEPTNGRIILKGRVASLLEVGTGFHPELTGRENIFLNGAILGMSKAEIKKKFDEIVDFAEVEKFLDTPVKRYSSGMYVRLAFAVAAHLEPEILLVDEVLAVGDAQFQKKCIGKMEDVGKEGRTVLFVSHNMAAIKGLCSYGILLNEGKLILNDQVSKILRKYLSESIAPMLSDRKWTYRHRGDKVLIDSIQLFVDGLPANSVQAGSSCTIRVNFHAVNEEILGSEFSISLMFFSEGQKLVNLWTNYYSNKSCKILSDGIAECIIPKWPFRSHSMRVDIYTHIGHETQDWIEECLVFDSYDGDYYGTGIITNADQGVLFLEHMWKCYANK
jgi:lipopolysaccharide transport system ATP-binding protein